NAHRITRPSVSLCDLDPRSALGGTRAIPRLRRLRREDRRHTHQPRARAAPRPLTVIRDVIGEAAAGRHHRPGFEVAGLRSPQPWMDPYLTIDHLVISQPQFRPHPHAGFSAITLMFEDSPGSISNRDSTGTHTLLKPGDLHWTQARSGVVNEEV